MKRLTLILFIALCVKALPCTSNLDCEIGSSCLKSGGFLQPGVCIGGMNPGNKHDKAPVYNPNDRSDTIGETCSYDLDCGMGRRCLKSGYNMYGTCY